MASNTKQDYRNYDSYNSNRVVPFDLPEEISIKIKHFSKITNLKTGSIDLILSTKGEYVFLEINPQGQFIGVSNYCNFYLDKEVAEFFKSA
jgi:D-alanine-D-alanine ligase-like ATP-grasp enzyme